MFIEVAKNVFKTELDGISYVMNNLTDEFNDVVNCIAKAKGRVVICGMGKSGHIGRKIFATFVSTGTPSMFLHPAEAFHGDLGMVHRDDIFIAISNSGETEELVKLIPFLKDNGNVLISITGNSRSTLANSSNFHLNIKVPSEACPFQLAPTASTTATLVMGDALAVALMSAKNFNPEKFARFHPGGALGRRLLGRVSDFMKPAVCVNFDSNLKQIIEAISRSGTGIICVKNTDHILGVITDGDIHRYLSRYDLVDIASIRASDIFTRSPKMINSNVRCIDADQIMKSAGVNSLLVLSTEGAPFIYQNFNRS